MSYWGSTLSMCNILNTKQLFRACLHVGGGPQVGEVTCGRSPHLSCNRDQIKMRDYMNRRVTSPSWGPPPPCKQALRESLIRRKSLSLSSEKSITMIIWVIEMHEHTCHRNNHLYPIGLISARRFQWDRTFKINYIIMETGYSFNVKYFQMF